MSRVGGQYRTMWSGNSFSWSPGGEGMIEELNLAGLLRGVHLNARNNVRHGSSRQVISVGLSMEPFAKVRFRKIGKRR